MKILIVCIIALALRPPNVLAGCSNANPNSYQLPYEQNNIKSDYTKQTYSSVIFEQCQFVDLNGDGLPEYICSFKQNEVNIVNCVYLNTGNGWMLAP